MAVKPVRKLPDNVADPSLAFPSDLLQVEGLLGMIMAECHRSAPERRQPVYALAAAICAVGVLAGRRYRSESDLRTNVYCVILGESSSGKGHSQKVVTRLLHEAGLCRYIGGEPASGSAILTELGTHPARLIPVDEFGIWLAGLTAPRTPKHLADIKKKLMTLFSDAAEIVQTAAYAVQKGPEGREREAIHEPHLCMLAAGTPGHFFSALQSGAVRDGFLPRMLLFRPDEFYPPRVASPVPIEIAPDMILAAQVLAGVVPVEGQNLAGLLPMAAGVSQGARLVPYDADGRAEHERQMEAREAIIQGGCVGYVSRELVGKMAEHAVKLGLIRAVSRDPAVPVLDRVCVAWGWRVAQQCVSTLNHMSRRHLADNATEANNKRVRAIIEDAGAEGITTVGLTAKTRSLTPRERRDVLDSLIDAKEITERLIKTTTKGGRPGFTYWAEA